ncbi:MULTISPECIES: CU044_5270 family protein [unclassified Streptomyces]|uniref:CU044_5270 family protein n=1 Tax=unclassified Streptomyces TaxID=2593676 RepID=UPI0036EDA7FA
MNDAGTPRPLSERAEVEEAARLLPTPAEWDLPPERHLHHKEALMQQMEQDRAASVPVVRAPRRWLRPAVLVPATALALAAALTAGIGLGGSGGPADGATPRAQAPGQVRQQTVALLGRLSDAALAADTATPVGDSQFVYVRTTGRSADQTSGKAVTGALKGREVWFSQAPGPVKRIGLIREDGDTVPINAELGDSGGTPAGIDRPTYRWLAALPTDPEALLTYLYARTPATDGQERDQALFDRIGSLIAEQIMPPETAAALYRAAARIPGVAEAPDATDATGRHGLGIVRDDTRYHVRSEWVFDTDDLSFLGSRSYLTADTPVGGTGTLLSSTAVMERAVVDEAGRRPTAAEARRTA